MRWVPALLPASTGTAGTSPSRREGPPQRRLAYTGRLTWAPRSLQSEVEPRVAVTPIVTVFLGSATLPPPPCAQRLTHDQRLVSLAEPRQFLGEHSHTLTP